MEDFMTCSHPARVSGMCVVCGKVLDEDELKQLDGGEQLHDISGVQVTQAEAARLDSESTRRLLEQRKLALIVDLDQTIIHATVDPTVGEWMKDQSNANFNALADVGKFLLGVDGKAVMGEDAMKESNGASDESLAASVQDGCWYYVKPRPGLQNFLTELSERYELHVYTMGTRTYAESVCRLVDPDGSLFGARIISRDENGSLLQKSLNKLFPMDTSMVAIIDDRADVWQWSPNLVRVTPFDFFVGIGDINASFLPSTPAGPIPPPELSDESAKVNGSNGNQDQKKAEDVQAEKGDEEANEEEAKAEDDAAKSVAEESQKTVVSEQLDARPLAKMQEALEGKSSQSIGEDEEGKQAAVLKETDRELFKLHEILNDIHARWYADYDKRNAHDEKPSITQIISQIKTAVLNGCTFVFSSIAPVNQDPGSTELWRLATEFGANCKRSLDSKITHVIAAKQGTEKVISGHRRNVHVVWYTWLQDSCARWSRQSEEEYALPNPTKEQLSRPPLSSSVDSLRKGEKRTAGSDGIEDFLGTTDPHVGEDEALTESDGIDGDKIDDLDDEDDAQGFDEMNWDEANDEVDAVLNGLSDDESTINGEGTDSGNSEGGESGQRGSKMKRTHSNTSLNGSSENGIEDTEDAEPKPQGGNTLSPLSKRRRMAELRAGHSKLKQVFDAPLDESRDSSAGPASSHQAGSKEQVKGYREKPENDQEDKEGQNETDEDFLKSLEEELALQLDVEEGEQKA